jgi:hypothetical protein
MPKEMNIFILEGEGKQENPHFAILYRNKAGQIDMNISKGYFKS